MMNVHVSLSLDGYVAGPDIAVEQAMGRGGDDLHAWMFANPRDPVDQEVAAVMFSPGTVGAVLMGRRTLDVGIGHWGDDGTFGVPCFVLSHTSREQIIKESTTFTFVTDGLGRAVERANAAAGGKDVEVMGADLIRQLLIAGWIDELQITLVPIILGGGTPLLTGLAHGVVEFEQVASRSSATVTHLRYRRR